MNSYVSGCIIVYVGNYSVYTVFKLFLFFGISPFLWCSKLCPPCTKEISCNCRTHGMLKGTNCLCSETMREVSGMVWAEFCVGGRSHLTAMVCFNTIQGITW